MPNDSMETKFAIANRKAWEMQMALIEIFGVVSTSARPFDEDYLQPTPSEWAKMQRDKVYEIAKHALGKM